MGSEFSSDQDTLIGGETAHTLRIGIHGCLRFRWFRKIHLKTRETSRLEKQGGQLYLGEIIVGTRVETQVKLRSPRGTSKRNGEFSLFPLSVYAKVCQQVY